MRRNKNWDYDYWVRSKTIGEFFFSLFHEASGSVQMISCHTLLQSDVIGSQGEGVRLGEEGGGAESGREVPARHLPKASERANEISAGLFCLATLEELMTSRCVPAGEALSKASSMCCVCCLRKYGPWQRSIPRLTLTITQDRVSPACTRCTLRLIPAWMALAMAAIGSEQTEKMWS